MGDLAGVGIVTGDILIYGSTIEEHNEHLKAVLEQARSTSLKLNPLKLKICKISVAYVGHILTQNGVKADPGRVQAIVDMPAPSDKAGVQRFLGMVGYVHKFIPNLSEIVKPLHTLLIRAV